MNTGINWTNQSVLRLAGDDNPIEVVERKARELVLRARDAGWEGPPFNPIAIADILGIPVQGNVSVADARIVSTSTGLRIEFNPTQSRERVRFSIAHELAHSLFPDVAEKVRHRSAEVSSSDDWQLEMLCNLAAAEFVMPIGSIAAREHVPPIEELMTERRKFDVSAEAYLIRIIKAAEGTIAMFCASARQSGSTEPEYWVDYVVRSSTAPALGIVGRRIPDSSVVYACTGIGYTDRAVESWPAKRRLGIECVGIPGYPGSSFPRVAAVLRFGDTAAESDGIRFVHGSVLEPRGTGVRLACQLVNDRARIWGGGVARTAAKRFPDAQKDFTRWITSVPRAERLGKVHFAPADESLYVVSLVAQEGYGPSVSPRIRYRAVERCLEQVGDFAMRNRASVHMPRIGSGQSGGSWEVVEELVRGSLVSRGIQVTVYDLPPRRIQDELFG